jgi:hypothetical protein
MARFWRRWRLKTLIRHYSLIRRSTLRFCTSWFRKYLISLFGFFLLTLFVCRLLTIEFKRFLCHSKSLYCFRLGVKIVLCNFWGIRCFCLNGCATHELLLRCCLHRQIIVRSASILECEVLLLFWWMYRFEIKLFWGLYSLDRLQVCADWTESSL